MGKELLGGFTVKKVWLENITKEEQKQCLISCESVGQSLFNDYKYIIDDEKRKYKVFLLYGKDDLIGWAIADFAGTYFKPHYKKADIYINIRPQYRRQRFGSKLLKKVSRYCNRINRVCHVHPHDNIGLKFFLHNKKSLNLKIKGIYNVNLSFKDLTNVGK